MRYAPLGMPTPTSAPPLHPEKSPTFRGPRPEGEERFVRFGRRGKPTPTSAPPPEGEESYLRFAPLGKPTPTSAPPPEGEESFMRYAPLGMSTPTSAPPPEGEERYLRFAPLGSRGFVVGSRSLPLQGEGQDGGGPARFTQSPASTTLVPARDALHRMPPLA